MYLCRGAVLFPWFFWVLLRENVHSLKNSDVGAIILQKVISRRQSFYVPTMNYCRFFIENYEISWGWLFSVVKWMKYQYFHFGVFHLLMICSPFRFFFFDASNFSIFHFLRLLELQFWAFEAPMWLPWLPFAASLACLLRIWNLFALPFWRWGRPSKQARQASTQERKQASKQTNKQANKQTNTHTDTHKQTTHTNKRTTKQANKQTNKQTIKQTNKRTNKQQRHTTTPTTT